MTIPRIPAYNMPSAADLPKNRVNWQIDPKRAVLLIHDMQNYFLNFFDSQQPPIPELFQNVMTLRSHCQSRGIPILYTAQPAQQSADERGLLNDMWGPGLGAQPHLETIPEVLAPTPSDRVFVKWRYSAFQRTDLKSHLQATGRDQLVICGIYAHIGCLMTACDAFMNDIQPFFITDAVADFSLDDHQMAARYVAQRCGMTLPTQAVVTTLSHSPQDAVMQTLQQQLGELLQQPSDRIGVEENLLDWGLDSLRLMSLVEIWQRQGVQVSFTDLAENPTIATWAQLLARHQTAAVHQAIEEKVS